jgi:hypothetical protein
MAGGRIQDRRGTTLQDGTSSRRRTHCAGRAQRRWPDTLLALFFHRLPAIRGDPIRTTCSTARVPIRLAENASLAHIIQLPGTMVGGSVSEPSGTIELSNEVPGTITGSQPGSHIGSHIGAQGGAHGSHSTPRFLRHKFDNDQFDGPRQPSADTTTTSAKNVSLFITSFSAQATCIHHGDC